jgi:hypothetical protein
VVAVRFNGVAPRPSHVSVCPAHPDPPPSNPCAHSSTEAANAADVADAADAAFPPRPHPTSRVMCRFGVLILVHTHPRPSRTSTHYPSPTPFLPLSYPRLLPLSLHTHETTHPFSHAPPTP